MENGHYDASDPRTDHNPTEEADTADYSQNSKVQRLGRADRRGATMGWTRSPMTLGRAPSKTGRPMWMREIDARRQVRAALLKIKIVDLIPDVGVPMMRLSTRYRNVWRLSQATRDDLLSINGFGPASLAKVHKYLSEKNVPLRWTA